MDADPQKGEALSGLEYLKQRIDDWHGSPMAETMSMRLVAVTEGTATFEAHPSPKLQSAAAGSRRLCGDAHRFRTGLRRADEACRRRRLWHHRIEG